MDRLRFMAFDILAVAGEDVRARAWEDRDACLRETLSVCERIRLAASQPATLAAHEAIVALGFEGTVLNGWDRRTDPDDIAPGPSEGALRRSRRAALGPPGSDGRWNAQCEIDGRRVHALASARTRERIGELVELVYSRVDADGSLREARVALAP